MNSFSLKTKIFSLAGFLLLLLATVGTVSYFASSRIVSEYSKINELSLPKTKFLLEAVGSFRSARIELLHLSAPGRTPEQGKKALARIDDVWASYDKSIESYLALELTSDEKATFNEYKSAVDVVRADFKKAIDLFNKSPDENSVERKEMLKIVLGELVEHGGNTRKTVNALLDDNKDAAALFSTNAKAADKLGMQLILGLSAFSFILGLGFAFLLARSLIQKFSAISDILSNSAGRLASASSEIAASSQSLSQSSTEQAASLQQTAASLEQITAMISKAADSAGTTESSSTQSQEKAIEGQKAVDHMMTSMNEISESNTDIMNQVNHSNEQMAEIVRVIQEIGNKTKVINDIVFQTKLLSFNASVEAARAGENGKGFSVVAEEVGNLAQMSGNAAKEISDMLESSISKVEGIVRETKSNVETLVAKGKSKVASGVTVANECSEILNDIVKNITTVSVLSKEISQATKEQSQGVSEINKAMGQLDTTTQQNSSASEETANAANELSSQAEALKTAVEDLVVIVQGRSAA